VHLIVDAAVAHLNLEQTLVSPCVVPWVDAKPVVKSTFITPTDNFDSVSSESCTGNILVHTWWVG
jgi:hypothetical protein